MRGPLRWCQVKSGRAGLALALLLFCGAAAAHEIEYRIGRAEAAVLQLAYGTGQPFGDVAYQIFYDKEKRPLQVGRTDARGRIVFLPEHAGRYRIKTMSEDGHGGVFDVNVEQSGAVRLQGPGPAGRWPRALTGIALLFGGFGLLAMFVCRRRS